MRLLFFFFLLSTLHLDAQIEITFPENLKTNNYLIKRFLKSPTLENIDEDVIKSDLQQIENLGLFYDLKYSLLSEGTDTTIQFSFIEKKSFLPFLNIGFITDEQFVQLGAQEVNFKGWLQTIGGHVTYYDRWSFSAYYNAPFIANSPFGLSTVFEFTRTDEPFTFGSERGSYFVDRTYFEILGGYYFAWENFIKIGGGILNERFERQQEVADTELPRSIDTEKYQLKFDSKFGRLNYNWSYETGLQVLSSYQVVFSNVNDLFHNFLLTGLYKKKIGVFNLASRLRVGVSNNVNSPFVPFVVDSYVNIRGVGNRVARGTAEFTLNLEVRYPFYDNKKLAIQAVAFTDNCYLRPPAGDFTNLEEAHFAGLGFRLYLYKFYGLVLRADYGFNMSPLGRGDFVFGLGQYF